MKQRITLLLAVIAMFVLPTQRSTAQNLYSYNFDTSVALPHSGWTSHNNVSTYPTGTWDWWFGTTGYSFALGNIQYYVGPTSTFGEYCPNPAPHTGKGNAILNTVYMEGAGYYGVTPNTELRSPAISLPSTGLSVITYWVFLAESYENYYCSGCTGYNTDSLQVLVNTSATATGATKLRRVKIDSSTSITPGWYKFADTIPASFNGGNVNIIFRGWSTYYIYGSDINLDDFSVDHYFDCSAIAGGPHAGTPSGPSHICRTKQFTLTDTGGLKYVGFYYQWQSRPTGTTAWTNLGTGNPLNTNIALGSGNTDYRVWMYCPTSGLTDTSAVWSVTADSFFRCYCAVPTTNTVIGGSTPPIIDSVQISATLLNNPTHAAYSNAYAQIADTVTQTKAVMTRGGVYNLYVKYQGTSSYGMAYADWNRSGAFNDTSSEYYPINSSLQLYGIASIKVPLSARTGRTGLRIRSSSVYSPSATYSCLNMGTSTGAGETVDYIITVVDPPLVDLGVTAITSPPAGALYCPNKADTIIANVTNFGSTPQSNFNVYANYNGPSNGGIYTTYTGTLAPGQTVPVYIGTIDPPYGGTYKLKVFTETSGDTIAINDTTYGYMQLYPVPADPAVKSDTVCPGGIAHIGISPAPYTIYKWFKTPTGGGAFDSTSLVRTIAPTSDTLFYISATDSGTKCQGNRISVTAAVRPAPTVNLGPDSTLCESPTFFLDAGNPGGSKYLWSTGDTTRTINPRVSGTYSVSVFHYCTASDAVNLTINPLPEAGGIDYVRSGNTYSYGVAGVLYTTKYKWFFGDGSSDTNASPLHTYAVPGTYSVLVVLYNDCGTDTLALGVPNRVNNISKQSGSIIIYPNPADNMLTVSAGDNGTVQTIVIVNAVGQVVYTKDGGKDKTVQIDVSRLPQGQYILRARTSEGFSSKLFDVLRK